jgi:hypothetical protein
MLSIRSLVACLAVAVSCAQSLAGNLVTNGGFETGNFDGWTVQAAPSGSSIVVTPGTFRSGAYSAVFGATSGQFDEISQTLPTVPGAAYQLSFWVKNDGTGGDSLQVAWNGVTVYDATPIASPNSGWYQVSIVVFSAATSSELRFRGLDGPSYFYLDDVVVDTNLIVNPGFETGNFAGWTTQAAASGSSFAVSGVAHTGAFGMYFAGVDYQYDQVAQAIATLPGRSYLLQFWVNNISPNGDSLRVWWEGNLIYEATPLGLSINQWTQLSFVVVSTGSSSELRFGGYDYPSSFSVDDFTLIQATNGPCIISGDADRNGSVTFLDITTVLSNFGSSCTP